MEPRVGGRLWTVGELTTVIAGLVLAISAFTDWYAGSESGGAFTLSVIGWHTGALGKLVFFVGFAVLALWALREVGIELPATVPDSLVVIALGSFVTPVLRWRTSEFAVTTSRVLVKIGLVSVHTLELMLSKVEAIPFRSS